MAVGEQTYDADLEIVAGSPKEGFLFGCGFLGGHSFLDEEM